MNTPFSANSAAFAAARPATAFTPKLSAVARIEAMSASDSFAGAGWQARAAQARAVRSNVGRIRDLHRGGRSTRCESSGWCEVLLKHGTKVNAMRAPVRARWARGGARAHDPLSFLWRHRPRPEDD